MSIICSCRLSVDETDVIDSQNCGNLLAGIGPFAIEHGMVTAKDGITDVRIFMRNTRSIAVASIRTPGGKVEYQGERAHRRRAGHGRADPDRFPGRRGLELRRASADRQTRATRSRASR